MFKNLFNKKDKNKKADYENLSLKTLKSGCMLDYFVETWEVKECYDYDWGNNFFTKEYQLDNGSEKIYLHVEDDGELNLSISRSIKVAQITGGLKEEIVKNDNPPKEIKYDGKKFLLTDSNQGYFREEGSDDWSEFVSWEFKCEVDETFLSVMRWGETDIEASTGQYIKEFEVSNLLPSMR